MQAAHACNSPTSERIELSLPFACVTARRFPPRFSRMRKRASYGRRPTARIIHLFVQADDTISVDDSLQIFAGRLLDDEVPS